MLTTIDGLIEIAITVADTMKGLEMLYRMMCTSAEEKLYSKSSA